MNANAKHLDAQDAPLPLAQFKRFVTAFHVVFIFGLVFTLVLRWRRPGFGWGPSEFALVGVVATQIVLYLMFFAAVWKPATATGWWLGYYVVSLCLWVLETRLEPGLSWVGGAYFGQMFGTMRPVFSVPMGLGTIIAWYGMQWGLSSLVHLGPWQWVGAVSLAVSSIALGLFFYRLTITSVYRAKLIQKLEAAQRELELARQKDAELATLRERERLARELHDSLGHGLVTLTVQLEAAQRLYQVEPERASELMEQMKQLTRDSMEQLRRALAGLRTPGLGEQALLPALRELCAEVQSRSGIPVQAELPENSNTFPPGVSEAIWRFGQEGLTNVQKHSGAKTARLRLQLLPGEVVAEVVDDGVGLPLEPEAKPGHYGLRGLRERVEGQGGTFTATSSVPTGTMLQARIPLVG